jgi:hypothetical protein
MKEYGGGGRRNSRRWELWGWEVMKPAKSWAGWDEAGAVSSEGGCVVLAPLAKGSKLVQALGAPLQWAYALPTYVSTNLEPIYDLTADNYFPVVLRITPDAQVTLSSFEMDPAALVNILGFPHYPRTSLSLSYRLAATNAMEIALHSTVLPSFHAPFFK